MSDGQRSVSSVDWRRLALLVVIVAISTAAASVVVALSDPSAGRASNPTTTSTTASTTTSSIVSMPEDDNGPGSSSDLATTVAARVEQDGPTAIRCGDEGTDEELFVLFAEASPDTALSAVEELIDQAERNNRVVVRISADLCEDSGFAESSTEQIVVGVYGSSEAACDALEAFQLGAGGGQPAVESWKVGALGEHTDSEDLCS